MDYYVNFSVHTIVKNDNQLLNFSVQAKFDKIAVVNAPT